MHPYEILPDLSDSLRRRGTTVLYEGRYAAGRGRRTEIRRDAKREFGDGRRPGRGNDHQKKGRDSDTAARVGRVWRAQTARPRISAAGTSLSAEGRGAGAIRYSDRGIPATRTSHTAVSAAAKISHIQDC